LRFLLSFTPRSHRVWMQSVFEVTVHSGSDSVTIVGPGFVSVTFLNPNPPNDITNLPPSPWS